VNDATKIMLLSILPGFVVRRVMHPRYERMIGGRGEVELGELPRIVRKGDLALDVGSNLGIYTYALHRLARQVVAFEPVPELARLVRRQNLPGVSVREIALSSNDGKDALSVPGEGHAYASLRKQEVAEQASVMQVATRQLDSLGLGAVGFIKIDVEGFEEEVLAGAMATIARDHPRMLIEIEERHNPGGVARVVELLAGLGYSCWFRSGGRWLEFSEFESARDQDPARLEAGERYVNNFLFMPQGENIGNA